MSPAYFFIIIQKDSVRFFTASAMLEELQVEAKGLSFGFMTNALCLAGGVHPWLFVARTAPSLIGIWSARQAADADGQRDGGPENSGRPRRAALYQCFPFSHSSVWTCLP
jgi:hypothetical protein